MGATRFLVVLLLLGAAAPARADDGPVPGSEAQALADPAAELQAAREQYVLGQHAAARARFLDLVSRARNVGDVPAAVEAEAWVFLGEIQLLSGDRRAAEASFRLALARDPSVRLSPVWHPEHVIGAFEVVRTAVLAETSNDEPRRRPLPWWGYAPFGVPQFQQRKPIRGATYAALQAGFAAASLAAWFAVDAAVDDIPRHPVGSSELRLAEAEREQALTLRNAWSFTTATAFYVTWAISVADAGVAWRRMQEVPTLAVRPMEGGAAVEVRGRF